MTASDTQIEIAASLLADSRHIVALTGAGISTPSGIPDFRSPNSGLWENADPFEVASIYSFRSRPQDFYDWIQPITRLTLNAAPNPAHLALAQMEQSGRLRCIITQNVDMLHSKAGSSTVHEVHGHFREMTCLRCYTVYPSDPYLDVFMNSGDIPSCDGCGGVLKPNVILIGEQLPVRVLNEAKKQTRLCDVMLVAGSSLEMAPAGDLPLLAVETGARLVIVNLEPTHLDHLADATIYGDVVDVLPRLASALAQ
ncbi:MAG: NAD-dependent deacylase [Chloroflexota bacterium]|nr:MAG: NAD-dependent deacylase [Chloroflexota bacterium]